MTLHASHLAKRFVSGSGRRKRTVEAVADVTFDAADGRITGLLGPNGAGKTTTLRIISTLVAADSGTASFYGLNCADDAHAVRARLGVLSDSRGLYTRLTARENIRYFAELRGMSRAAADRRIDELAALADFTPLLDRRTEGFSQGERMKVALARALVHDPQNLILDEPTNGLDIVSTRSLRALLARLRDDGKCIVFSSHVMQEVSALCDEIVVIARGRAVATGDAQSLMARSGTATLEDAFVALAFDPVASDAEPTA
ncbi:ATP-binding cassette domain-containing protein [soil metagenome]